MAKREGMIKNPVKHHNPRDHVADQRGAKTKPLQWEGSYIVHVSKAAVTSSGRKARGRPKKPEKDEEEVNISQESSEEEQ
ncbi:hypothetical protein JD844_018285 [Phrynosoma platyrhinos]|uniref:Uncharacterized protein n=1 Tax=Phrynosoma platyrhinos TaxID=52577 RepID=A0ABQ7SNE7_PHRPL|nr:hypothetical protein JD844_018285 [Phrynosoma platyrhinos]